MNPEPKQERDDLINPYWIEDRDLKKGEVDFIGSAECQFWKDMLDKYLYPIDENEDEKVSFYLSLFTPSKILLCFYLFD